MLTRTTPTIGAKVIAMLSMLGTSALVPVISHADNITDWNVMSVDLIADQWKSPAVANRAVALVQTSVYTAVNAITKRYPQQSPSISGPASASVDAAVAAANKRILDELLPDSSDRISELYESAINKLPADQSRSDGISVGEQAAEAVLALRSEDRIGVPESYRPQTTPGTYVPTVTPAATNWSDNRLPWAMSSSDQLRPSAPPALNSERWAADYNEIKSIGAHDSQLRTDDQTQAAMFWIATSPSVYFPVVRSVTSQPDRDPGRNARLFAMVSQSIDDAIIAVFDAKYHYSFWRPITAIRNGDRDDNNATDIQPDWQPLVKTPMHPEYPCAHCIVSGTLGHILKLDLGDQPAPVLSTASPTAGGATRSWNSIDEFTREVADARIWEGVHYRYSAEVGTDMGRQVAELVAKNFPAE